MYLHYHQNVIPSAPNYRLFWDFLMSKQINIHCDYLTFFLFQNSIIVINLRLP